MATISSSSSSASFHQLVAIPLEQYNQMLSMMNMRQPIGQKITRIQNALSNPTIAAADGSNPYDHMIRQGMMLDELKRAREQLKNGLSAGTPKPYRNRALALYNQIAPLIQFNDKGELLINKGSSSSGYPSAVVGSRAEDLIQHAVRDRRKHFTPTGWSEFAEQLHKHNIPRMMLNHATIEELQARALPPSSTTAASSSSLSSSSSSSSMKKKKKKEVMLSTPSPPPPRGRRRVRTLKISSSSGEDSSVSPARLLSAKRVRAPSKRYPKSTFLTHFKSSSSGSDFGF